MLPNLILLWVAALSPAQDDPARDALQRLQDVFRNAKTVTLRAQTELGAARGRESATSTVIFKDSRVSISGIQKTGTTEQAFATIVDSGKIHIRFDQLRPLSFEVPKDYAAELRKLVPVVGVVLVSALTQSKTARDQIRTPEKYMTLSDLKLSDDGKSLRYSLKFAGINTLDIFGTFSCTLRLDPATGKITGRTLSTLAAGVEVTVTESYELTLDAEIPDALLKVPEEKPVPRNAFKPTECLSTQCPVNVADAKEGRWTRYLTKTEVSETRYSLRVVGRAGADWLIEAWFETETLKYAWLYQVGADRQVRKAWVAAEGDTAWTSVPVKEGPKPAADGPKIDSKESEEKKQVLGGDFDCQRVDATINLDGRNYTSSSWYSKDVWRFVPGKDHHGGLVAMESGSASTVLEAKGEDGKPTIPLPKE
jgi:hypothetical protein